MSNRRVVSELSKLWDTVASKGRLKKEGGLNDLKKWVSANPTINSLQTTLSEKYNGVQMEIKSKVPSPEIVAEKTKKKVGKIMSAYEDFIGIGELRSAQTRVLSVKAYTRTEAKFIESQEHRRIASKSLSDIHNKLMEIRAELDHTQRGDESYLDLIKEEISLTKQEKVLRKYFEELERTEREVFSELSSALSFSHEKERAQNEKTKYWSIVGSIFGATLGVLGSTINNRIKQNHVKHILEETASQVKAIQSTVDNLSLKINETEVLTSSLSSTQVNKAEEQEKLTQSLEKSVKILHQLIFSSQVVGGENMPNFNQFSGVGNGGEPNEGYFNQVGVQNYLEKNQRQISAIGATCVISYLLYRLM